jgi:MoxR-like ATPase
LLGGGQILAFRDFIVNEVPASPEVCGYAVKLARSTRPTRALEGKASPESRSSPRGSSIADHWIECGAGPRASINSVMAAHGHAALHWRPKDQKDSTMVFRHDIIAVAKPVLRHRILLNYEAQARRMTTDHVIDMLLEEHDRNHG